MSDLTIRAEDQLIARAEARAQRENTSLAEVLRRFLVEYVGGGGAVEEYRRMMEDFRGIRAGRTFTRDEANER